MATRLDVKNFLECSICLEQYNDPKTLKCTHDFCNECLENLLAFDEDGSATVACPMRCPEVTLVNKDETLNSLATSITLTNMMKALNVEDLKTNPSLPTCRYESKCRKEIVSHCCDMLMCQCCSNKHQFSKEPEEHVRNAPLKFCPKKQQLNVMCAEHASKCLKVCDHDSKLLCVYCLNRDDKHVDHSKSCVDAEVKGLREALDTKIKEKDADFVLRFRCLTEEEVLRGKDTLNEVLRQRKEECMRRYQRYLDRKEKLIRKEFEETIENHMKKYPEPLLAYYTAKLNKCDAELLLQKEEITRVMNESKRSKSLIKMETISMSDSFDFRSQHPLGKLEAMSGEDVFLTSQPVSTLRCNFKLHQLVRPRSVSIPSEISPKHEEKVRPRLSDSGAVQLLQREKLTSTAEPSRSRPPPPPPSTGRKLQRSRSLPKMASLQSLLSNLNQRVAYPQRAPARPQTPAKAAISGSTSGYSAGTNTYRQRSGSISQTSSKRESKC